MLGIMAKIVAIVSSPQKNANTDLLVNKAAEAAKKNGNDVEVFSLNTIADKKGCQGCDGCKKNGTGCVIKDGLTPVLDAIRNADGVIISSPVYFGEACGQYRMLEDRFYGYLKADFSLNINAGKKVAVITAAGSAGAEALADKMEGVMKGYLKFESVGKLAVTTANDRKFAETHPDVIAQAEALGKKF